MYNLETRRCKTGWHIFIPIRLKFSPHNNKNFKDSGTILNNFYFLAVTYK